MPEPTGESGLSRGPPGVVVWGWEERALAPGLRRRRDYKSQRGRRDRLEGGGYERGTRRAPGPLTGRTQAARLLATDRWVVRSWMSAAQVLEGQNLHSGT